MQALLGGGKASRSPSPSLPTHVQEQKALRDETISAFHQAVATSDDEGDDMGVSGLRNIRRRNQSIKQLTLSLTGLNPHGVDAAVRLASSATARNEINELEQKDYYDTLEYTLGTVVDRWILTPNLGESTKYSGVHSRSEFLAVLVLCF